MNLDERKDAPNDLNLRHWREYGHLWTDSLWIIPRRERRRGYPREFQGSFVPQVAAQVIQRFSRKDEVVLDLFLGTGTTGIEAMRLGRRCIGVDLQRNLVRQARTLLKEHSGRLQFITGDSAAPATLRAISGALARWSKKHADLLILHPPYTDVVRFSEDARDLSNAGSTATFFERFRQVSEASFQLLRPGRFAILVMGDKYQDGALLPLGFECMRVANEVGFQTRAIVVKNIEGNERGKGRDSNLWRYRALRYGFYIFKHEYVIILRRPPGRMRSRIRTGKQDAAL